MGTTKRAEAKGGVRVIRVPGILIVSWEDDSECGYSCDGISDTMIQPYLNEYMERIVEPFSALWGFTDDMVEEFAKHMRRLYPIIGAQ